MNLKIGQCKRSSPEVPDQHERSLESSVSVTAPLDIEKVRDDVNGIFMPISYSDSAVSIANCRSYFDRTGMTEADIYFNARAFTSGSASDFETIALHEIGHLLGLSHTPADYPNALMRATISGKQRFLAKADVAYIQKKYPK